MNDPMNPMHDPMEHRLRSHLAEQAAGISVDGVGAGAIMDHSPRGKAPLTALAAVLLLVVGGAGFWWLSNGDNASTEIAAVADDDENDESSDGDGEGEGESNPDGAGTAAADAFIDLEAINISDENSPGSGEVLESDGVYYVLSTSPGRVDTSNIRTDEEWAEFYRQDTLYIYAGDGWTSTEIGDRFISDLGARDGVLYAVSTGSATSNTAAFGTSNDQGQSWDWQPLDGVPEIDSVQMVATDSGAVMFASRWGHPDYDEVLNVARDSGLNVTDRSMRNYDHTGFSYIKIDDDDPCSEVASYTIGDMSGFIDWVENATDEEREAAEQEWLVSTEWMQEEFARAGCPWDERFNSIDTMKEVDLTPFEPVWVTWDEIGFTPPETWQPWGSTLIYDGSEVTVTGVPFGEDRELSYATVEGDQLVVIAYTSNRGQFEGDGSEAIYRTSDGRNWTEEVRNWSDGAHEGDFYHGPGYVAPIAGAYEFALNWDQIEYSEEAPATTVVVDDEGNEAIYERVFEEPAPLLQRRTNGGEWETIDPTTLAPDVDLGDKQISEVHGTANGVMLVFSGQHTSNGPPEPGIIVLHSNNGVEWGRLDFPGNSLNMWSHRPQPGQPEQLVFSNTWPNEAPFRNVSEVFLVRPAG